MDLGMTREAQSSFDNQLQLEKTPARASMDRAYLTLLLSGPTGLGPFVANDSEPDVAAEGMLLAVIGGARVDLAAVEHCVARMQADPTDSIDSYRLFLGHCTWLHFATLYSLAGREDPAERLMSATESQLRRIVTNGNVYHTIAYFEARIAALRGQRELALQRLKAAVAAGWRRGWWIRFDPAFRTVRELPGVKVLLDQIDRDMALQRRRAERG